jgi:hypothetical protein
VPRCFTAALATIVALAVVATVLATLSRLPLLRASSLAGALSIALLVGLDALAYRRASVAPPRTTGQRSRSITVGLRPGLPGLPGPRSWKPQRP